MVYLMILWMGAQTGQVTQVEFNSEETCISVRDSLEESGAIDAVLVCAEK